MIVKSLEFSSKTLTNNLVEDMCVIITGESFK